MQFQFDIKQLLLNSIATVHAEDLTQMYSYSVQQKSTLLGLVCFMKNSALPEHHVASEFNAKMQIFQQVSQIESTLLPWLKYYPVLNTFIIPSFFQQRFVSFLFYVTYTVHVAYLTVFLGQLYILPSHKMPAY